MKNVFLILFLFLFLGQGNIIAQSVKINFIRYKTIYFNNYQNEWDPWPVAWDESGASGIIKKIYGETYKVSIYNYKGDFVVSSTCTFDSKTTAEKRKAQPDLPYLNCYVDSDGDQVWTNVVSLESLLNNVKGWGQEDAQLYLWIFNSETPYAILLE